ncbi:MAG: hypothetical protein O3A13_05440 [Proteobacteria bacterium]|nr:hypothetical protein [Pseudomonadota bacterium]MDA0993058.1 hypothetical protein [Pseudomonadota bacterium]
MKTTIILFGFLAILGFAAVGSMYIFDVKTGDEALELLIKVEGTLVLLGICSVVISMMLAGAAKKTQD